MLTKYLYGNFYGFHTNFIQIYSRYRLTRRSLSFQSFKFIGIVTEFGQGTIKISTM